MSSLGQGAFVMAPIKKQTVTSTGDTQTETLQTRVITDKGSFAVPQGMENISNEKLLEMFGHSKVTFPLKYLALGGAALVALLALR